MAPRSSVLERELEQLLTLSRADIELACTDARARVALVEFCIDEEVELREAAAEALDRDDADTAAHCEQEASAWRHTARVLRDAGSVETSADRRARLA